MLAQDEQRLTYYPTPTLESFHADRMWVNEEGRIMPHPHPVRGVSGPVGSSKSSGMCLELYFRAIAMPPSVMDNVRRFRAAVIRNTYSELKSTAIKTWEEWMPQAKVVYDTPIRWRWSEVDIRDGTGLDMEVWFLALDRPDDVKKLKSMELTMVWLNEAIELPKAVLDKALERVGRYPSARHVPQARHPLDGQPMPGYYSGVIMDTNMPDEDHWWPTLTDSPPLTMRFWRQPPALVKVAGKWVPNRGQLSGIPPAENVENQPKGWSYWTDLATNSTSEDYIKVYLGAQYGLVMDGKPVFPEYFESQHKALEPLRPIPGIPLYVGLDFGLTPCAITAQRMANGRWLVLDELVSDHMGIERFADLLGPFLAERYAGISVAGIFGDPAGGTESQTDEKTCFKILQAKKIPAQPSPDKSNNFTIRREAVASLLTRTIDGKPGIVFSPTCKTLCRGMAGGYYLKRVQVAGEERYRDEPEKNTRFSHPCDALQYLVLGAGEGRRITQRSGNIQLTPAREIKPMPGRIGRR